MDMSNITQGTRWIKQNSLRNKPLSDSAYNASDSLFEDLTGVSEGGQVLGNGRVLGKVVDFSSSEEEESGALGPPLSCHSTVFGNVFYILVGQLGL